MWMKKLFSLTLMLLFCGTLGFGLGSKDTPDLFLANGCGSTITKVQIVPSEEKYPNSGGKEFNLSDIRLEDTGILIVQLPSDMKKYDTVNITVQCGFRKFTTRQAVNISKGLLGKPKMLDLSKVGRESTFIAATGIAAGGTLAVATIGSIFITGVATNGGAAYVAWALATIGGTMATGVAVVAAIPLAAASIVGGIAWGICALVPGELVVKSINYKTLDTKEALRPN